MSWETVVDALKRALDEDEAGDRALALIGTFFWGLAALTALFGLSELARAAAGGWSILAGVPFCCAIAFQLPRTRSRTLAVLPLCFSVLALCDVLGAPGKLMGVVITPFKFWLLVVWNLVEIPTSAYAARITFAYHRRHRLQVGATAIAKAGAAFLVACLAAWIVSRRLFPDTRVVTSHDPALLLIGRSIVANVLPQVIAILFIVPRMKAKPPEVPEPIFVHPLLGGPLPLDPALLRPLPPDAPPLGMGQPAPSAPPAARGPGPAGAVVPGSPAPPLGSAPLLAGQPAVPSSIVPGSPAPPLGSAPLLAGQPAPEGPPGPAIAAQPAPVPPASPPASAGRPPASTPPPAIPRPPSRTGSAPRSRPASTASARGADDAGDLRLHPLLVAAPFGIAALGLAYLLLDHGKAPAATHPPGLMPETPPPPAALLTAEPAQPRPGMLPRHAIFGGHPLTWWGEALTDPQVKKAADTPRYQLLLQRAEANGFVVKVTPGVGAEIEVPPALEQRVQRRWTRGAIPESAPSAEDRIEARAALDRLVNALEVGFAHDAVPSHPKGAPRVIFARRAQPTAALRIQFAAGAYHDQHLAGLTRLSLHALLRANAQEGFDRFERDLDAAGATLELETGLTESAVTLEAPAEEFDPLAERLIRLCLKPRFAEHRLEIARTAATRRRDDRDLDALSTEVAATAFHSPGMANDSHGDPDALRGLTSRDVANHLASALAPANATVVLTGGFDAGRMRSALAAVRGGEPVPFNRPREDLPGTYTAPAQLHVHLVAYAVSLRSPDEVAAVHLVASAIQERLFVRLRGLGVAYDIEVMPLHYSWLDFILVAVPFGASPSGQVGTLIESEVEAVANDELGEDALVRNQRAVIERFAAIDGEPRQLARALASPEGLEWVGPAVARAVAGMGRDRLGELARPWLASRQAIHIVLSPEVKSRIHARGAR